MTNERFCRNYHVQLRRRHWGIVLLLGLMSVTLGATGADAQRTGSRIGRDANAKDGITGVRLIAECYYGRAPQHARSIMALLPGDAEERKIMAGDAGNLSACLDSNAVVFDGKQIGFQPRVLRGPLGAAMAKQLLKGGAKAPQPAPNTQPWFYDMVINRPADRLFDKSGLAIQEFGHCVAVARWEDSLALVKSDDGSAAEKAAVEAIIPALGGCLDAGNKIQITKRNLRDFIGEPVYHLLLATNAKSDR